MNSAEQQARHDTAPFVTLQRVVVRMLFDPDFVEQVYQDPQSSLAGLGLEARLIEQLVGNDQRLWNADQLRRRRALKVLMEELKISSTLALNEARSLSLLDDFFSSRDFHDGVQLRRYMALAYASYLQSLLDQGRLRAGQLQVALKLEAAIATARRALRDQQRGLDPARQALAQRRQAGIYLACAPGVHALTLPEGILKLVQHVEEYLFEVGLTPALALCDDAPRPDPLPELSGTPERYFLIEAQARDKLEFNSIDDSYGTLIAACSKPSTHRNLRARLSPRLPKKRLQIMIDNLTEEGVLRQLQRHPDGRVEQLRGA